MSDEPNNARGASRAFGVLSLAIYKRLEALAMLHNVPPPPARQKQRHAKDDAEPAS